MLVERLNFRRMLFISSLLSFNQAFGAFERCSRDMKVRF
jgi:hypothetical protein